MKQKTRTFLLFMGGLTATAVYAHEHDNSHSHTQLGSHVHGEAYLQVAAINGQMQVLFQAPAGDLIGFEHAPNTQEQHDYLQQTVQYISSGQWLSVQANSPCELQSAATYSPQTEASHSGHGDLFSELAYTCPEMSISGVELSLFAHYPAIKTVTVHWLLDDKAGSTKMTADKTRIDFR